MSPVQTGELDRYNLAEPQSGQNAQPNVIASASTVAPVHKLTEITGTTSVVTITPPVDGYHVLYFVFTNGSPGVFSTAGNVKTAYQPVQDRPIGLHWYPQKGKYYVEAVV